jgi:hypothetical protein
MNERMIARWGNLTLKMKSDFPVDSHNYNLTMNDNYTLLKLVVNNDLSAFSTGKTNGFDLSLKFDYLNGLVCADIKVNLIHYSDISFRPTGTFNTFRRFMLTFDRSSKINDVNDIALKFIELLDNNSEAINNRLMLEFLADNLNEINDESEI